jgi:hypothetical protein
MIKIKSNFIILTTVILSTSIIFSLALITTIESTYANHTKYHFNNSLVDVTISGDDIPDALLEDIKTGIAMKSEKKASENNNSQLQTKNIEDTAKAKIILTSQNFKKGDLPQIVGQVKNVGNGTAKDIRIAYTYYDQNNDILGSEIIYIDISKLIAGQQTSFSNYITDELVLDRMTHYQLGLTWYDPDGSEVYVEDAQIIKENKPFVMNSNKGNENIPNFTFDSQSENEGNENEDDDDDDDDDMDNKKKDNKNKNEDDDDDG